jgi:integrase
VEEGTRQYRPHQYQELSQMGRGPGVRATSASSIQIDFRYKGRRCRERLALPPTPANLKYARRLKATIEHEIATQTFDYAHHFPESPRAYKHSGSSGTSLRNALLAYCNSLDGQLEPETIEEYSKDAAIAAAGLEEISKGLTLESLTRTHVRTWVATLTLSKKRINNLLRRYERCVDLTMTILHQ